MAENGRTNCPLSMDFSVKRLFKKGDIYPLKTFNRLEIFLRLFKNGQIDRYPLKETIYRNCRNLSIGIVRYSYVDRYVCVV